MRHLRNRYARRNRIDQVEAPLLVIVMDQHLVTNNANVETILRIGKTNRSISINSHRRRKISGLLIQAIGAFFDAIWLALGTGYLGFEINATGQEDYNSRIKGVRFSKLPTSNNRILLLINHARKHYGSLAIRAGELVV